MFRLLSSRVPLWVTEKVEDSGKIGPTTSLIEMENHSQRVRHWHAAKPYVGCCSGDQLHNNPMTTPSHGTENDKKRLF